MAVHDKMQIFYTLYIYAEAVVLYMQLFRRDFVVVAYILGAMFLHEFCSYVL